MLDSKAFFSVAKREKQVIRRHPAHIAQTGAHSAAERFLSSSSEAHFQYVHQQIPPVLATLHSPKKRVAVLVRQVRERPAQDVVGVWERNYVAK